MPLTLDEGWNQVHFNLADFVKRAYGGCGCKRSLGGLCWWSGLAEMAQSPTALPIRRASLDSPSSQAQRTWRPCGYRSTRIAGSGAYTLPRNSTQVRGRPMGGFSSCCRRVSIARPPLLRISQPLRSSSAHSAQSTSCHPSSSCFSHQSNPGRPPTGPASPLPRWRPRLTCRLCRPY